MPLARLWAAYKFQTMNSRFFSREHILIFFVMLLCIVLLAKLFLVQVVHSNTYADRADHQYVTPSSDIYERGTIYFTQKDGGLVTAAVQASGYKIAIAPNKLKDPETAYQKISQIVSIDKASFLDKAGKKNDPYEEVADRLTREQADAVSALDLSGVSIYKEKWRFYPGKDLASHALGFVGYIGNALAGRYGLERQYENVLSRGQNNPYVNFFAEVFSDINKTLLGKGNMQGDVVTSIEPEVQGFLENTLSGVKDKYNANSVGGIIMNPEDGSIYAMAARPDFDPNNFSDAKSNSVFSDPLVESVFEFGSVVKPLVMAAALDKGVVTPETTYYDPGHVTVDSKVIYNFDKKGRGTASMQEVLTQSLNTGMVYVAGKLGHQNMRDYLLGYDIDKKTGIDLPNETSGLVSNLNSPRDLEYANAAFGQGIAFTPVELVRALSSLINGGKLVVPHLASEIKYDDGLTKTIAYSSGQAKISKATSEEIAGMMVKVMDQGVNKNDPAGLSHYSIGVKTGTAQVPDPSTGGYYPDRYMHSFVGFFPAYDPKFIIFLYARDPKGVQYSAETWTQPFESIAKFLINYYQVPPDR